MRLRSAWVVAVLALGCGSATEGATFDESSGNGGSGGDTEPLDESSGAGGSTGGAGGSVSSATVGSSSSGGASSSVAASSSSASLTSSTSSGTSSSASATTGPTATATETTTTATSSSATTATTSSVSTSAATISSASAATTGETATSGTTGSATTGTTGGGCECEAPENPDLEHIAYLTDPTNLHVSCCDGCHYREALSRCIVAVECFNSYNFRVQWATCDGESDVCADHGIAADPGLNSGLTGAPCSLRSSGENEECEQLSDTEAACY